MPNNRDEFLKFVEPFKQSIAVGLEATFNWYWLVDFCKAKNIDVYLGHPFYMKAIHGGKHKNDHLDADKQARLLNAGLFPESYACPPQHRGIRDLVRRRQYFVYLRSSLYAHIRTIFHQQNTCSIDDINLRSLRGRQKASDMVEDPANEISVSADIELSQHLDTIIRSVEQQILAYSHEHRKEDVMLLMSIPGVGKIIALTILYEVDDINRFKRRQRFSSYCRLVRPQRTSNGKRIDFGNARIGNPYLKCVFMEILSNAPKCSEPIQRAYEYLKEQYPPIKARAIMAQQFCTAVYFMLKRKKPFNINMFINGLNIPKSDSQAPKTGTACPNQTS